MPQLPPRINLNSKEKWRGILDEVEKKEVPVEVLEKVTINVIDGTVVDVNIRELLEGGADPHSIQEELNEKLNKLDDYIDDVDFHINIDAVVDTVQPVTDKILRNL